MTPRRARITKTKTFAGCWTCRRRKVKCDNRRPQCRRCGETCEGYNVDLYWMSGEEERPCAIKRKAMLVYDPELPLSCETTDIDRMLQDLEESVAEFKEATVGPYTVFKVIGDAPDILQECDNVCDGDWEVASIVTTPAASALDPGSPHLSNLSLFIDSVAAELMHNYIHVVSHVMQPISHPQNPYRSIYAPRAIAAGSIIVGINNGGSHSGAALSHALLAVSAFHLYRHQPEKQHYDKLARLHRVEALSSLKKALVRGESSSDSFTTLSAMLSLVSIDLMEGGMTEFWVHLNGCNQLKSSIQGQAIASSGHSQLIHICSFMSTLACSTDPFLAPEAWTGIFENADDLRQGSPFLPDDHSLEFTYGTTATLATYLHLTISLSQNCAYYELNQLPLPEALQQACDSLCTAISHWSIDQETLASLPEDDYETRSLITCHVIAFHAAVVIYFHSVLNYSAPGSILRTSNRVCVSNLLAAEALKSSDGARKRWNAHAPIVWPGFIAACEAELDERPLWQAWWTGVQKYCLGSIVTLWDVVQEVWRARDAGNTETPGWRGILRQRGRRVMSGG